MALEAETVNELAATVARFVRERLRPLENQVAEDDAIPANVRKEIADLGLFGEGTTQIQQLVIARNMIKDVAG